MSYNRAPSPIETMVEPSNRPPLGLPSGSVRAYLTLLVLAVIVVEVVRGHPLALVWSETLMIVLAHYFTSRRLIDLPAEVMRRLQAEGHVDREANPLFMPRHSIRTIIVLTFVGLAAYLYHAGRIREPEALSILVTVFAYMIGVVGRSMWTWWTRNRKVSRAGWWDDAKAVVVMIALVITAAAYLIDRPELLPKPLNVATLGLVLFYFGSR
jgi:Kef-type K+ transport system membrane component KefB